MTPAPQSIDLTALPAHFATYLEAHKARDLDVAVAAYTADATVTDEGRTYTGPDQIRAWLGRSASEYTCTIEMTGATMVDDTHYDVTHHLEGNFPGGQADLHFRFTVRNGLIAQLIIEP